jgi:long-subunit acyl-CoA synthetase (AMP-forming)
VDYEMLVVYMYVQNDTTALLYSSGTTRLSKGVAVTHRIFFFLLWDGAHVGLSAIMSRIWIDEVLCMLLHSPNERGQDDMAAHFGLSSIFLPNVQAMVVDPATYKSMVLTSSELNK